MRWKLDSLASQSKTKLIQNAIHLTILYHLIHNSLALSLSPIPLSLSSYSIPSLTLSVFNTNTLKCQQKQTTVSGWKALNAYDGLRSDSHSLYLTLSVYPCIETLLSRIQCCYSLSIRQQSRHSCNWLSWLCVAAAACVVVVVAVSVDVTAVHPSALLCAGCLKHTIHNRQRQLMFTVCMKHQSDFECDRDKTLVERTFKPISIPNTKLHKNLKTISRYVCTSYINVVLRPSCFP